MTTSAGADRPAGRFLDTPHGRIFVLASAPQPGNPPAGHSWVVVAAPFAEEMNKCRRMWTLLGRELAAEGVHLLIPDLHGTGESDGDFADARWEFWREDLQRACAFARERGAQRIILLGVRLGALLALEVANEARSDIRHLLLWQPVSNGQQHLTQFLRLKLAAGMRQGPATRETTATLRARLHAGERLEIAGYELSRELVARIDALDALAMAGPQTPPIEWLEVSTSEPAALLPASERVLEKWRGAGVRVRSHAVGGDPFWALQEITIAPALNAITRILVAEAVAA